jgi:hypothetical protein
MWSPLQDFLILVNHLIFIEGMFANMLNSKMLFKLSFICWSITINSALFHELVSENLWNQKTPYFPFIQILNVTKDPTVILFLTDSHCKTEIPHTLNSHPRIDWSKINVWTDVNCIDHNCNPKWVSKFSIAKIPATTRGVSSSSHVSGYQKSTSERRYLHPTRAH